MLKNSSFLGIEHEQESSSPRRENGAQLVQKMHKLKKSQISPFKGLFHFRSREHVWTVKTPSKRKPEGFPAMFWATRDNRSRGRPPENEKLAVLLDKRRVSGNAQLVDQHLHIALKRRMHLDADDIARFRTDARPIERPDERRQRIRLESIHSDMATGALHPGSGTKLFGLF